MSNQNSNPMSNNIGGMNYIPPNPIGNIINIGGQGYNNTNMGGYYNGLYNGYYNPILAQRQKEIEEANAREAAQQQSSIMKRLSKSCHKALKHEIDEEEMEEHLKQYDLVEKEDETNYQKYCHLVNLNSSEFTNVNYSYGYNEASLKVQEDSKKLFPDTTSLAQYLENAGELYASIFAKEAKQKQRDVSKLYNSSLFKNIVGKHTGLSNLFNSSINRFKDPTVDDMEIGLPDHIKNNLNYQERRKKFMEALLANK
jgi:hypothetical protein